MPSETDLANVALRHIGGTRITSFTDGSKNANAVNDIYVSVRDGLLAKHNWNFATQRVELARSATVPAFEFDYGYVLPSDWIRTISVHDNDAGAGSMEFRVETNGTERVIVASRENVFLRYVARITDPNMWPTDFISALEYALARALAIPVANSNTLSDSMAGHARAQLGAAKSADAIGASPERRPAGSWVGARGGWGGSPFSTTNR